MCCNDRTEKHFNKCLITSLGSDSVCELTDLDNFDIKMSHIDVYIALQKNVSHQKEDSETEHTAPFIPVKINH